MRVALATMALLIAAPAAAQQRAEAAPDFASMSEEDLVARLTAVVREGMRHPCTAFVPVVEELNRRHQQDRRYEGGLLMAQAHCAYEEERYADGLRDLKRAERAYPERGNIEPLGLWLAGQLKDGAETLSRLQAVNSAGRLERLSAEELSWLFRSIREGDHGEELDAFAYEIVTSGAFARLDTEVQELLAPAALSHAASAGQRAHVEDLLRHARSPYSAIDLLAQRKYEPLWPQIERHAGDNLRQLSDDYIAWTASRLADKPEDRNLLGDYAHALLFAGRYAEAAAVVEGWLLNRDEIEEGDGWALNIQAYAYDVLGRPADADAVFDRLAQLNADDHPWVVNFVINREGRLVSQGRWEEGLAASEIAKPVAAEHGSAYARMLVAVDRACAFHKLGRSEESERELDFIRSHVNDAPTSAIEAMLCADREDEAVRMAAGVLDDDAHRPALLDDMQDDRFALFGSPTSVWRDARELIMAHPELRDKALRFVRIIPDRFVPVAYLRRQEITAAADE